MAVNMRRESPSLCASDCRRGRRIRNGLKTDYRFLKSDWQMCLPTLPHYGTGEGVVEGALACNCFFGIGRQLRGFTI